MNDKACEILKRAKNLIEDKQKWCQRTWAVDENGRPVSPLGESAVKWCSKGAIRREAALAAATVSTEAYLYDAAHKLGYEGVAALNDLGGHSKAMEAFDVAIKAACKGGSGGE